MSKKHTRKPAPYYPPSWFALPDPNPLIERIVHRMIATRSGRR